jgi:predicted RNA binding protein YcfA (HicA-like mRNA interferase family)
MAKHDRTLDQIRQLNGSLHWTKVENLLKNYGAEVHEGSGSTVTFVVGDVKLTVDRPHPRKECGKGLVKRVREYLKKMGKLERERTDKQEK